MRTKFLSKLTFLSLAFFAFGVFSVCLGQDGRFMGGVGITVFEDRNFRGKSATYTSDVSNLDGTGFNDRISSIRVGPGEQWEVCKDANFQGRCVVVSGTESDLRKNSWDDMISSMRRVGGSGGSGSTGYIVLFDQPSYRGNPTNYNRATPNLYSMNGRARSVTIGGGSWDLCEGTNYTGRCITMDMSSPSIPAAMRISSVRPTSGYGTAPPTDNPYIVIFDRENYRGNPTNYNSSRRLISKKARSITIGSGVWEICDGLNFTGRCITLSQSTSRLAMYNIGSTIRSVRPVTKQPR